MLHNPRGQEKAMKRHQQRNLDMNSLMAFVYKLIEIPDCHCSLKSLCYQQSQILNLDKS
jgi:hypothetical protein